MSGDTFDTPQKKSASAAKKSLFVTLGSIANIGIGFAFQLLLARSLGVSPLADIYSLGTMVPTLAATILIGSTPSVLVPAISRIQGTGEKLPLSALGRPTILIFAIGLVVLLGSLFSARALGASLTYSAQTQLIVFLAISSLSIPLAWATAVAQSLLISKERFLAVGLSGAINGVGLIAASAVPLVRGLPVQWLAVGFIVGYAIQALVQSWIAKGYISLRNQSRHASFPVTKPLATLMVSSLIYKSQPIIERSLAAYVIGGPAIFNYSSKLAQAVLMGSTLGLSLISLPSISRNVAAGDVSGGWLVSQRVSATIAAFSAPLVVTGILAGPAIVRIIYGGGNFTTEDVKLVAMVLAISLVGVLFSALSGPTVNFLYATNRYTFVAAVSVTTTIVGAVCSFALRAPLGLAGIAVGSTVAFAINFIVYTFAAARTAGASGFRSAWRQTLVVIAVAAAGLVAGLLIPQTEGYIMAWIRAAGLGIVTIAVALVALLLLRRRDEGPLLGSR